MALLSSIRITSLSALLSLGSGEAGDMICESSLESANKLGNFDVVLISWFHL